MTCFFVTGMVTSVIKIVERIIAIARNEMLEGSDPKDETPR